MCVKMTFFTKAVPWSTVPVLSANTDVSTAPFLQAAESFVRIFDAIGSVALLPVRSDLSKNVETLKKAHAAAPEATATLATLAARERSAGRIHGDCALTSLVWLGRGLRFMCEAFIRFSGHPKKELKQAFSEVYPTTLGPHHGWFQRLAFQTALAGAPTRAYFLQRLGSPSPDQLADYFQGLSKVSEIIAVIAP